MNDYLQNATLRQMAKMLNLPLPIPPVLKRNSDAYSDHELITKKIVITGKENEFLHELQKEFHSKISAATIYDASIDGLIVSCIEMESIEALEDLYTTVKNVVNKIAGNGRVVIISRIDDSSALSYTVQRSIDGFSRALSKEIGGKKGIAVNLLKITNENIMPDEAARAAFFFLSDKSSFITGQVIELNNSFGSSFSSPVKLLQDKIAIVTGSARGIGASAARVLHREGAKVILIDVPAAKQDAEQLAQELHADVILEDITDIKAAADIQQYVINNYKGLDILVNNAGITRDKTIAKMSIDQWRSVLNVNLKAAINLTEIFIEKGFNKHAKVVGLSSISGIAGNVGQTNYSLSKAGMLAYMHAVAKKNPDLFANAVAPGFIETKMTETLPFFVREGGRRLSTFKQGGLPEDVAELIGFLCSPLSDGINGQCIRVCGGSMIGA
ncbi:MAG: fabG 11 [Bacteroidota bacterium]|nr:fabG 11 [Bacteroidota bacterium]